MSSFSGTRGGKVKSRTMAHEFMANLNRDNYYTGNHLYLAGPEAGDVNHALCLGRSNGNFILRSQIFAAEHQRRSYESAVNNTKGLKEQIHHGCIVKYAEKLYNSGIEINNLFLDICGRLQTAKMLIGQTLPFISYGSNIAININCRDALKAQRNELKSKLSKPYRNSKHEFAALAMLANYEFNDLKIYFSVGISYANTNSAEDSASQMLTLIGRRHNYKPTLTEPAYLYRLNRNGVFDFAEESTEPSVRAFKAHLPGSYKLKAENYLKIARQHKMANKPIYATHQTSEKKVVQNPHNQHMPTDSNTYEIRVTDSYRAGHSTLSITRKFGNKNGTFPPKGTPHEGQNVLRLARLRDIQEGREKGYSKECHARNCNRPLTEL